MLKGKWFYLPICLFFLVIYAVPIFWVIRGERVPERSLIEGRTLRAFPKLSFTDFKTGVKRVIHGNFIEAEDVFFNQFTERTYQKQFEQAASNQFPLRLKGISVAKTLDRKIIELAFLPLNDAAIPTDFKSDLYILKEPKAIIFPIEVRGINEISH